MPKDFALTEADIDLLREACAAKGGVVKVPGAGDIRHRFARTVSATRLNQLGYFEAVDAHGWRIKPALKADVAAVLKEHR